MRDNKSEALYELSRVNVKFVKVDERVSNFTFTLDLSYIASILLRALRVKADVNERTVVHGLRLQFLFILSSFFLSFNKALSSLAFNYKPTSFISGGKKY